MNKIISIDGSDCTGKSTLTKNLAGFLTGLGNKVKVVHFPRYETKIGQLIKSYLNGEYDFDPAAIQFLYIADQMDYSRVGLLQDFPKYDYIILDRFKDSSLVYFMALKPRSYATEEDPRFYADTFDEIIEEGNRLHDSQSFVFEPDLRVILHASDEVIKERLDSKEKDVHESNHDFMRIVNKLYSGLKDMKYLQLQPTMTIDVSNKSEDEVLADVLNFINKEGKL